MNNYYKTCGWFTFEDGYRCWCNGYSKSELAIEILHHGKVVHFEKT